MNERDKGTQVGSQSLTLDASETTNEEKKEENRQQKALQELFLILQSDAEREGKPVNAVIRGVPILITTGSESTLYILRINPAIVQSGKLNVVVLDLYRDEIYHVQQWVVKAEWPDGKPKITGLDESMVEEGAKLFELTKIAEYAGRMLSGKTRDTDATSIQSGFTMIMPPEYSTETN